MLRVGGALSGRRIAVTRARAQAGALAACLLKEGADVIELPAIRIVPLATYVEVDRAIDRLSEYDWVVFTSRNAVEAFFTRLRAAPRAPAELARARLAAIGPATAGALAEQGVPVALAPKEFVAEALVDAFAGEDLTGRKVLLPRAQDARSVLPDGLKRQGAIVDVVPVYRVATELTQDPTAWGLLSNGGVDAVTFTSSSTVRSFVELAGPDILQALRDALIACIGPVTAATASQFGLHVGLIAGEYTIPGLVEALREALKDRRVSGR